jgi:hypothetical protein
MVRSELLRTVPCEERQGLHLQRPNGNLAAVPELVDADDASLRLFNRGLVDHSAECG